MESATRRKLTKTQPMRVNGEWPKGFGLIGSHYDANFYAN
jgi:hypothetical protein